MQVQYKTIDISNPAGTTASYDGNDADKTQVYFLEGSPALTGNISIGVNPGTYVKGTVMRARWFGSATVGAGTPAVTIFGVKIPEHLWTRQFIVESWYNGSAWQGTVSEDVEVTGTINERDFSDACIPEAAFKDDSIPERAFQDESIPAAALKPRSVSQGTLDLQSVGEEQVEDNSLSTQKHKDRSITNDKNADMIVGTVKVGDAGHRPSDLQMNDVGPGAIIIAQGYPNAPQAKQMIGQGTIDKDGVFSLHNSAVTGYNLGSYAVTVDKADTTMIGDGPITVEVDTADGSYNEIMMGFKGFVASIRATVKTTIVGNGAITANNDDDVAMTDGVITLVDGHTVNQSYNCAPTDNNTFEMYDILRFKVTGTTGGKLRLSIILVKLP